MVAIEPIRIENTPNMKSDSQEQHLGNSDLSAREAKELAKSRKNEKPATELQKLREEQPGRTPADKQVPLEAIKARLDEANQSLDEYTNKALSFFVDEDSGKSGVRVIDKQTGDTIKQIPPEEFLELSSRLKEKLGGLLDETG